MMSKETFNLKKIHWAKCTRALQLTKEELHPYIKDTFVDFEKSFVTKPYDHDMYLFNGLDNVKFTGGKWCMTGNVCQGCINIFNLIMSQTDAPHQKDIGWKNVTRGSIQLFQMCQCYCHTFDVKTCFCKGKHDSNESTWIILKIFMKPGNSRSSGKPDDIDAATLFQMMEHCKLFDVIPKRERQNLTGVRNTIMHSTKNKIEETDMNDYFDTMIKVLNSVGYDQCNEAAEKLKQLKDTNMVMQLQPKEVFEMLQKALKLKGYELRREIELIEQNTLDSNDDGYSGDHDMSELEELKLQLDNCEKDTLYYETYEGHQVHKLDDKVHELENKLDSTNKQLEKSKMYAMEQKGLVEELKSKASEQEMHVKELESKLEDTRERLKESMKNANDQESLKLDLENKVSNLEQQLDESMKNASKLELCLKSANDELEKTKRNTIELENTKKFASEQERLVKTLERTLASTKEELKGTKTLVNTFQI